MCKKLFSGLFGGGGGTNTVVQQVAAPPTAVAAPVRQDIDTGASVKVTNKADSASTTQLSGDGGRYSSSSSGRETTGRVKLGVESKRNNGVAVGLTI